LIETKIKENVKVQVLNESLTKNTLEKSRLLKSLSVFEMKTQKDAVNVQRTAAKLAKLIDDLDLMRIQLGATSSTDETLEKEVKELEIKISALKDIVPNLELKLQKIQSNIQDANAKLADKTSRETTIDRVLNEASNKAYTLQGEVERFGPQAIAGEETVKNLIIQLKNDYVPLDEFKVEDTRLKELTQVVTESSKEIQLLRKDLFDIRSIEQSYIEKCLADRQCKAVMGERLGVE
jgi:chromosome segregation ATPase